MNYTLAFGLVIAFALLALFLWFILKNEHDVSRHFWKIIAGLDFFLLLSIIATYFE